ncbi:hypothetical protein UNSWDHB_1078 [Dehalobacter sp. UNSWDHB]|nr:hypothetical protein DHBDCA_p1667 [Dehalobacter sp. DCA]AFV05678.1 hypothetical protein DCF50_p1676 [Dehalobacter sp. CF]EQB21596.1 hypothetical protein UNSWDHB_1078 [Dehalobacter sp. UNSWDHB]
MQPISKNWSKMKLNLFQYHQIRKATSQEVQELDRSKK